MIFDRTSNSGMVKNPAYDRGRWYQYKIDEDIIGDTPFYRTFEDGLNMIVLPPNMVVIDTKVVLERQNIEGVGAETGCIYGQIGYTTYSDTNLSYPAVSLPDPDHMEHIKVYVFGYIDGDPLPVPQDAYWTPITGTAGGGGGSDGLLNVSIEPGDNNTTIYTLSKTYADITGLIQSGTYLYTAIEEHSHEYGNTYYIVEGVTGWGETPSEYGGGYYVEAAGGLLFRAQTVNDFPVYIEEGGS